jgi:hypothetical protein
MALIKLPYATISIDAPIVYFQYTDGAELGSNEMKELISAAEKLSWSKPYFTLSDVRVNLNITRAGKIYLADFRNLPFFRGSAVLVKSSFMSFAANFLLYFRENKYPYKAFTSRKKAVQWLKTLPLDENPDAGWQLA